MPEISPAFFLVNGVWRCEFAQKVWKAAPISGLSKFSVGMASLDLVERVISDFSHPAVEIFSTTTWAIWNARNAFLWEDKVPMVNEICHGAAALAIDFLEAGANDCESVDPCFEQRMSKWLPPMTGFKLNLACRCVPGSVGVGVGILIRDSSGLVATAMENKIEGKGAMVQVQAEAVGIAIQFAFDIGLRHLEVEVEVGCQDLISLISKASPCGASCGVLFDDICWWIPRFNVLTFSFISKLCNKAIFALSTEALYLISAQF